MAFLSSLLLAAAIGAGQPGQPAESSNWVSPPISATFSIVAVDPESGVCGAAVASKYPAVGKVVPYVRAGVGAFCTQHDHVPEWGPRALDLLEEGKRPEAVLLTLLENDANSELRQLAVIDIRGRGRAQPDRRPGEKPLLGRDHRPLLLLPGKHAHRPGGGRGDGQGLRRDPGHAGRSADGGPCRRRCRRGRPPRPAGGRNPGRQTGDRRLLARTVRR